MVEVQCASQLLCTESVCVYASMACLRQWQNSLFLSDKIFAMWDMFRMDDSVSLPVANGEPARERSKKCGGRQFNAMVAARCA